jgi:hypothetical protein
MDCFASRAMTALQLKRLGCLKIESNNKPARHARTWASIHLREKFVSKKMDHRVIWREDARSLSSGRALRGPVGASAR